MRTKPNPGRPTTAAGADGRKGNSGANTLKRKLEDALATAPDDATLREIASTTWAAYEGGRDPADVWPTVLADSRSCPCCDGELAPAGNSTLHCLACDRDHPVGSVP